jgi:hypothetical protein
MPSMICSLLLTLTSSCCQTFLSLLDSGINYRGRNVGCYMAGVSHDLFAISGYALWLLFLESSSVLTTYAGKMSTRLAGRSLVSLA